MSKYILQCTSTIVAAVINARGKAENDKLYIKWVKDTIEEVYDHLSEIENEEKSMDSKIKKRNVEDLNRELFSKRQMK